MGGLACHLDFGFSDTKAVHIVSITHLKFDRKNPLARETEAFCKHRIERLEKLYGGMPRLAHSVVRPDNGKCMWRCESSPRKRWDWSLPRAE